MAFRNMLIKPRFIPRSSGYEWFHETNDASVEEGDNTQVTIRLNRHGFPRVPCTIQLRPLTSAEFAAQFPGKIQAGGGQFTASYASRWIAAASADPLVAYSLVGEIHILTFEALADQFVWTRQTVNLPSNANDYTTAFIIESPSQGTVATAAVSIEILSKRLPVNTSLPTLDQTVPVEGVPVNCSTGSWTNPPILSYAYQWQLETGAGSGAYANIGGATTSTYTPVSGNIGRRLRCRVTATNAVGAAVSAATTAASSAVTAAPAVIAPVNTVLPVVIPDNPTVGSIITWTHGQWDNNPTSFTDQLQREISAGSGTYADVAGIDQSGEYTVVSGDSGRKLRVDVAAINSAAPTGVHAVSAPTTAVSTAVLAALLFEVPHGPSVLPNLPQGTKVCTITGLDSSALSPEANPVTLDSVSFAVNGDDGGRFQLNGFDLEVGPTGVTWPNLSTWGNIFRFVTVKGIANGVEIEQRQRIRPKLPAIVVTGGAGGVEIFPTTESEIAQALASSAPTRIINMRDYNGVFGPDSNTTLKIGGDAGVSNITIIGHPRFIMYRGGYIQIVKGNNVHFKDIAFRVGGYEPGFSKDNRDSFSSGQVTNELLENCSFSWSIDESASWITISGPQYPRNTLLFRCMICEPLSQAGHSKGNHAFGPLTYWGSFNFGFVKCFISGMDQRSPLFKITKGGFAINNVIANFGPGGTSTSIPQNGGTSFANSEADEFTACSGRVFGNAYKPYTNPRSRTNAFAVSHMGGASALYFEPADSEFPNRFYTISGGVPDYDDNFVVKETALLYKDTVNLATIGNSIVDYHPFDMESDYGALPTDTVPNFQAMVEDTKGKCGVRLRDGSGNLIAGNDALNQIDYDHMTLYDANGTSRLAKGGYPNGPPPAAYVESNINSIYYYNMPGESRLAWPAP